MLSASLTHGGHEALSSSSWSTATKSTPTQHPGQGPNPACHTPVRTFKVIKGVLVATREDTGRTSSCSTLWRCTEHNLKRGSLFSNAHFLLQLFVWKKSSPVVQFPKLNQIFIQSMLPHLGEQSELVCSKINSCLLSAFHTPSVVLGTFMWYYSNLILIIVYGLDCHPVWRWELKHVLLNWGPQAHHPRWITPLGVLQWGEVSPVTLTMNAAFEFPSLHTNLSSSPEHFSGLAPWESSQFKVSPTLGLPSQRRALQPPLSALFLPSET